MLSLGRFAWLLLIAVLGLPWVAGAYWVSLVTQMFIFGLLALSADLLLGHAGLFSLCHAAFFSVAAYTSAILQVRYGSAPLAPWAVDWYWGPPWAFCLACRCAPAGCISFW